MKTNHLRIRVRESLEGSPKVRIEVLDVDGNVLGDLTHSTMECSWNMGIGENRGWGLGVLTLQIAAERASVDSIELKGSNIR